MEKKNFGYPQFDENGEEILKMYEYEPIRGLVYVLRFLLQDTEQRSSSSRIALCLEVTRQAR